MSDVPPSLRGIVMIDAARLAKIFASAGLPRDVADGVVGVVESESLPNNAPRRKLTTMTAYDTAREAAAAAMSFSQLLAVASTLSRVEYPLPMDDEGCCPYSPGRVPAAVVACDLEVPTRVRAANCSREAWAINL